MAKLLLVVVLWLPCRCCCWGWRGLLCHALSLCRLYHP
eukprot:COSAG01_NODE_28831_length_651_cov_13.312000_1_plen_37_part_10